MLAVAKGNTRIKGNILRECQMIPKSHGVILPPLRAVGSDLVMTSEN